MMRRYRGRHRRPTPPVRDTAAAVGLVNGVAFGTVGWLLILLPVLLLR